MTFGKFRYLVLWFLMSFSLVVTAVILDNTLDNPWTTKPANKRCEKSNESNFLRQPHNSFSSLSLTIIGFFVLIASYIDMKHGKTFPGITLIRDFPIIEMLFGLSLIFSGLSSFYFHACDSCNNSLEIDLIGVFNLSYMTMVLTVLNTYLVSKSSPNRVLIFRITLFSAIIGPIFSGFFLMDIRNKLKAGVLDFILLAAMASTFLVLVIGIRNARKNEINPNHDSITISASAASLTIAFLAWIPENFFGFCSIIDEYGIHLHSIWHTFAAFALFFLFVYFRSLSNDLKDAFLLFVIDEDEDEDDVEKK